MYLIMVFQNFERFDITVQDKVGVNIIVKLDDGTVILKK
jgi:hypothetical protein